MLNRLILLPALLGIATLSQAAETLPAESHIWLLPAPPPSSLRLQLGGDSESGGGQLVDANLAMGRSARFRVTAVGGVDGDGTARDSHQWLLGISSNPQKRFEFGLITEEWGSEDDLVVRANSISLQLNGYNWSVAIEPGERVIEADAGPNFDGSAVGLRADWKPQGFPRIDFNAVGYDYDEDPTAFDAASRLSLMKDLSPSAIALPRRLEDWYARVALTWDSSQVPLGLEYLGSESAVDGSQNSSVVLTIRMLLGKVTTMRIGFGHMFFEERDEMTHSSLALDFRW